MAKEKTQREPPEKPEKDVSVEIPQGQFALNFYANTFGIEQVDTNRLVHFGLLLPKDRTMGSWACVVDSKMLEANKKNWLEYLTEVDYPKQEVEYQFRCEPSALATGVPFSNLISLSRTGDVAEYRFFSFVMGDVLDDRRLFKKGKVKGQAIAIVRSTLELQRQFIVAMYGELIT